MLPNPPFPPQHSKEEFTTYVDSVLQPALQNVLAMDKQIPIGTIPPYTPSPYDGLYSLPFSDLISLCQKYGIDTTGCRIKYHIVPRIRLIDEEFHLLNGYPFPPLPPEQLIQQYREQLLAFNGAPDMVTPEEAAELVKKKLLKKPIELPIATGNVIVLALGSVKAAPSFYTHNCLYPVGFHSRKLYDSLINPKEEAWYDCWIQEKQNKVLFVISLNNAIVSYGVNINDTWNALRNRVNEKSVLLNYTKKQQRLTACIGEDYYGLSNKSVQMALESQPETLQCKEYLFYSQRAALGHAEVISSHEVELKNQEQEYLQSRMRVIQTCFEEQRFLVTKVALDALVAKCRDIIRSRRLIARLRTEEFLAREQAMKRNNERVLAGMRKQKSGIRITIKRKAMELPAMDMAQAPSHNTRNRQDRATVAPQVNTRKRQRDLQEEENIASHPSPRELYSFPVRALMIKNMTVVKAAPEASHAVAAQAAPPLPEFKPLTTLPKAMTDDALALWHFLALFSRVLQIPRFPFDVFAAGISQSPSDISQASSDVANPSSPSDISQASPSDVSQHSSTPDITSTSNATSTLDDIMSILLLHLFTQLKSVLSLQDIAVPGWRPFTGRRVNRLTWPEFARILFVCKTWALNGRDPTSITRVFMEDSRKTIDAVMLVDPLDDMMKTSTLRNEEFERVIAPLSKQDKLRCIRAAALIKRLRLLPLCASVLEPSEGEGEESMDLHTLDEQLMSGAFTKGGLFDDELFFAQLSLLWRKSENKEMEEGVSALYQHWVVEAKEEERGPWDEVAYIGQGCKLCVLSNEEMSEEALVTCDVCEASFHLSCVVPPLREVPEGGWVCGLCQGFASQERWKRVEVQQSDKSEFDATVLNAAVLGQMPLKPVVLGPSCGKYDYQELFDAQLRSPVFFGYEVDAGASSSPDLLSLPVSQRYERLAVLLATEDPHEMSLQNRFAVVSAVVTLASDLPEVRHFVERTAEAAEEKQKEVFGSKGKETVDLKRFCDGVSGVLSNRGSRRRGKRAKKEEASAASLNVGVGEAVKAVNATNSNANAADSNATTKDSSTAAPTDNSTAAPTESSTRTNTTITTPERGRMHAWTQEEIATLKKAVETFGEGHWAQVVQVYGPQLGNRSIPGRTCTHDSPIAIREKWKNLQPPQAPLAPLPFVSLHLPATYGAITIVSLGVIRRDAAYASKHFIWPVGFKSFQLLPSLTAPSRLIRYTSEILSGDYNGPIFRVSSEEELDVQRWNATEAWADAAKYVESRLGRALFASVNGPDLFGFGIDEVALAIQHLPGADFFKGYQGCARQNLARNVVEDESVLKSQWHPACLGYAMEETGAASDVTRWSPIFMGYSDRACEYCEICGMPGRSETPV